MKVLFDLNVVFDVLADREPFSASSRDVLALAERNVLDGWIAAHSVTTLFYLLARRRNRSTARKAVGAIMSVLQVAAVDDERLAEALVEPINDFEDAVQSVCARSVGAQYIVTRDAKDFRKAGTPAVSPQELIAIVAATES